MHPTWCMVNGALNYVEFRAAMHLTWLITHGAVHHVGCTTATNPTWFVAERVGFEPTSRDYREPLFESGALSQLGNLSF